MALNDPAFEVPTPTGTLQGTAAFLWNGTAWVAQAGGSGASAGQATGNMGGFTPQVAATMTRPSDATGYTIGDLIANSQTAASVVPISFVVARSVGNSGRISGARCTLTAASGTIVLPAFDLLLFRAEANIPFAAAGYPADNAALVITSAAYQQLAAMFSFSATSWRNNAGGSTAAGAVANQSQPLAGGRPYASFNLLSYSGNTIYGLLQAQSAWAPGAVAQQFDFALDVDQD